jgi:uncharacterized circularly permuted ATP-grasp superfamily protein
MAGTALERPSRPAGGPLAGYASARQRLPHAAYDEAMDSGGGIRPHYSPVLEWLKTLSSNGLAQRAEALTGAHRSKGITFDLEGEERIFPLDLVPRILDERDWRLVQTGVAQRVRALEALLADIYGAGRVVQEGVIPAAVITSSPQFTRAAHGFSPPNGVRIHVSGIDIVRDEDGQLCVLEDNVRCPSGVSYVLANRAAMAQMLPELFTGQRVQPLTEYPARLLAALRAAAPHGIAEPIVVVLTPGVFNSAFYEHALLARLMGVELIEGRDLVVHGTRVFVRTTEGESPVHVIYRRIDDDYLDPLHFRPDSLVGCPGLLNAARAGGVTIANAVGDGVADDKLVYSYVPDLVRYYLDEAPVLPNVPTARLTDPDVRAKVLTAPQRYVFKRVDGSGGRGLVLGSSAGRGELDQVCADVAARPRAWIAQPVVGLSTVPTWADGCLVPRHVDLRPFAVHDGDSVWVLPGGLTRVALTEGGLVVNSSQGGGSKDTWVIADSFATPGPAVTFPLGNGVNGMPAAAADPGPELDVLSQQQQQQQQQRQRQTATC